MGPTIEELYHRFKMAYEAWAILPTPSPDRYYPDLEAAAMYRNRKNAWEAYTVARDAYEAGVKQG